MNSPQPYPAPFSISAYRRKHRELEILRVYLAAMVFTGELRLIDGKYSIPLAEMEDLLW